MNNEPLAQQVFDIAFRKARDERSAEYKLGVLNCLKVRLDGEKNLSCPYPTGSAQADAYFAGIDEGRALSPAGGTPIGLDKDAVLIRNDNM